MCVLYIPWTLFSPTHTESNYTVVLPEISNTLQGCYLASCSDIILHSGVGYNNITSP